MERLENNQVKKRVLRAIPISRGYFHQRNQGDQIKNSSESMEEGKISLEGELQTEEEHTSKMKNEAIAQFWNEKVPNNHLSVFAKKVMVPESDWGKLTFTEVNLLNRKKGRK